MSRHRFVIQLDYPDAEYEKERLIHARGSAPLPEHPCDFSVKDLSWIASRPEATVEIVDYVQVGPPS